MTMMKTLSAGLAILSLGFAGAAMAATDGTEGATSQGSFNLSLDVNAIDSVRVYGLDDLNFGTVGTDGSPSATTIFCVSRNTPQLVRINLTNGSGGFFKLDGPNSTQIPISLFARAPGLSSFEVQHGVNYIAGRSLSGCLANQPVFSGQDQFEIVAVAGSRSSAVNGNYSGVFTITASPE